MSLAYFPLFPDDFEADTAHLTLAEDGAYNRLLRLCWRSPGCKIPKDDTWIFRKMRARTDEDKSAIKIVIDEFFTKRGGKIFSKRLLEEWVKANDKHERRVLAGSKGGSSKSLKTNKPEPSNAVAKPKQPEPEPEPLREVDKSTSCSFDEFWKIWPVKTAKQAAQKAWKKLKPISKQAAFDAVQAGWFDKWQQANPHLNPIHPASFLNGSRWSDEFNQLKAINGGHHGSRDNNPERVQRIVTAAARGTSGKDWG